MNATERTPKGEGAAAKIDHYKVRGEAGSNIVTDFKDGRPVLENPPVAAPPPSSLLPSIIQEQIGAKPVALSNHDKIAHYRFALIKALWEEISQKPGIKRHKIIKQFLKDYNSGSLLSNIFKELKKVSRPTMYRWIKAYKEGGIEALVPQYRGPEPSEITPAEKGFLRDKLLNQNRPKIADAIRQCKCLLGEKSSSSPAMLRRYVNTFKSEFHDVWTLDREGQKAWNDKCAPYQDRAWWTLKVGEILVADGHRLNFRVIDPHTGKPSRAALVMFWDWYSSFPVGWEVMLTENIQCVATALRNAILALGKIPDCVYLDNGKAFKAKCFTRKIILEESEIPGMFDHLDIEVMFAMKYNAQAKPIERIFGVLEWLERQVPTFVGNSINDKPAGIRPNEDRAKKLWGSWTPKVDQVDELIRQWRDFYVIQPLRGRKNQTAKELFEPGRGPGIDPKALCFLMLKAEVKGVRRGRLTFDGFDWAGNCLYGIKQNVIVRYSLSDRSRVYVFDLKDRFLGVVEPVDYTAPRDHAAARRITAERRRLFRQTKTLSNMAKTASPEVIDLISRKDPDLLEYIEAKNSKNEPQRISPWPDEESTSTETGPEIPKNEIIVDSEREPSKSTIFVDPRTGLSRPSDGRVFKDEFEYYDWYRAIEEMSPGVLNKADWGKIETYEASEEWEDYYGRSKYARMAKAASDSGNSDLESRDQEVQK
jgi:putative transposase